MRLLPRLHDTYVGQVVLVTVLLTWAVLVGLDVVMALSGEIGDLGTGNYTFGHAVAWVLYTVPRRAYTMFPTAAVIGSQRLEALLEHCLAPTAGRAGKRIKVLWFFLSRKNFFFEKKKQKTQSVFRELE